MNEKLSVVIPSRDAAPWVSELIESVLAQDVHDCEVLVVDNGSKDGTPELVEEFAAADSRVRLVRSDATSAGAARNEGIAAATGHYLAFADSDDIVPDGAYRSMLDALDRSGSDMVIGDHLKFSSTATWSPTKRWHAFDVPQTAVSPDDAPVLLTGRACWNRMFRRSFWDRVELRFPEIPNVDDIEPMTRAFVSADLIDVVPAQVYLYRDRSDGSSISQKADALTTVRYFQQEFACARLVAGRPDLIEQHARIVLDADGWAHLARFVASGPSAADTAMVGEALKDLLEVVPTAALGDVAPIRRVLWDLVLNRRWDMAASFVLGSDSADALERLHAWRTALGTLHDVGFPRADLALLVEQGLLPTLVNGADAVPGEWLDDVVQQLRDLPVSRTEPGLRSAMAEAVARGDAHAVVAVSALRHVVPLVVCSAKPTEVGLEISGSLPVGRVAPEMTLLLRCGSEMVSVPATMSADSWSASLDAGQLRAGRWTVAARAAGLSEDFPVVTARMPLPPVEEPFLIQPLADRKDGWRFLVDRRTPSRRGIRALLARVGRKFR